MGRIYSIGSGTAGAILFRKFNTCSDNRLKSASKLAIKFKLAPAPLVPPPPLPPALLPRLSLRPAPLSPEPCPLALPGPLFEPPHVPPHALPSPCKLKQNDFSISNSFKINNFHTIHITQCWVVGCYVLSMIVLLLLCCGTARQYNSSNRAIQQNIQMQ